MIITLAVVSGCRQSQYDNKITLGADNILIWHETSDGFYIELTATAKEKLYKQTKRNLNKPFEIYIGPIMVSSLTIEEPTFIASFYITLDRDKSEEVLPILPLEKRSNASANIE
jgi:hypothetical protein